MNDTRKVRFDGDLLRHIKLGRNDKAIAMLNPDLAKASDKYETLLHIAAVNGNAVITRHLIDLGSDVDSLGCNSKTLLMLALELENAECIEILLDAGADYDIPSKNGFTALSTASYLNDPRIIELFYRRFKNEASTIGELVEKLLASTFTLPFAILLEDIKVVEGLLQRGYDVNSKDRNGETPLHVAARRGNFKLVKLLVDYNANVNALCNNCCFPLIYAVTSWNADIMRLLLERGADLKGFNYGSNYVPLSRIFTNLSPYPTERLDTCVIILLRHGAFPRDRFTIKNVLQRALHQTGSRAIDYLIGHMAMLEMIGSHPDVATIERCGEVDDQSKVERLKESYKLCQQVLKANVLRSMSLFDLIIGISEYRMRVIVRDETFDSKVEKLCFERKLNQLFPYYHLILADRIAKAKCVVKLEDEAISVIGDIFQRNENECYVAARKIVGYLNERDLQNLCRVIEN